LSVTTSGKTPTGVYKAAVCDRDGMQLGYIEVTV
jgi:hypothetical protein